MTRLQVLGVSGSPVKESNTETLVKAILESTGAESGFIKLSDPRVGPCNACMRCTFTNFCVVEDGFVQLAEKVMEGGALVLGSPVYYGTVSAYTRAFMERICSKRHLHLELHGKPAETAAWMATAPDRQGFGLLGSSFAKGTPCCFACGASETGACANWNATAPEVTGEDYSYAETERIDRLPGDRLGGDTG